MNSLVPAKDAIIGNLVKLQQIAVAKLPKDTYEDLVYTNTGLLIKEFHSVFDKLDENFKASNHALPYIKQILQFYNKDVTKPMLSSLEYVNTYSGKNIGNILHPKILLFVI